LHDDLCPQGVDFLLGGAGLSSLMHLLERSGATD
jgi:hypothetical protein